jgi:hypothetical protein
MSEPKAPLEPQAGAFLMTAVQHRAVAAALRAGPEIPDAKRMARNQGMVGHMRAERMLLRLRAWPASMWAGCW